MVNLGGRCGATEWELHTVCNQFSSATQQTTPQSQAKAQSPSPSTKTRSIVTYKFSLFSPWWMNCSKNCFIGFTLPYKQHIAYTWWQQNSVPVNFRKQRALVLRAHFFFICTHFSPPFVCFFSRPLTYSTIAGTQIIFILVFAVIVAVVFALQILSVCMWDYATNEIKGKIVEKRDEERERESTKKRQRKEKQCESIRWMGRTIGTRKRTENNTEKSNFHTF